MAINTFMSELIGAGADAMANLYEVIFTLPTGVTTGSDAAGKMRIRTDGFTPPSDSQQTYDVHWKTVSLPRPGSKVVIDRQFPITFRVDAHWDVYNALLAWKAKTSIGSIGYASQEIPAGGKIEVRALGASIKNTSDVASAGTDTPSIPSNTITKWVYEDVWIESITNPDFSTENGEPAKTTATFRFGKYSDNGTPATV